MPSLRAPNPSNLGASSHVLSRFQEACGYNTFLEVVQVAQYSCCSSSQKCLVNRCANRSKKCLLPFPMHLAAFIRERADDTDTPDGLPPTFGDSETAEPQRCEHARSATAGAVGDTRCSPGVRFVRGKGEEQGCRGAGGGRHGG